jgi:hypothetical protein
MSTERDLGAYITALVDRTAEAEPAAWQQLRATVGARRARITLDRESVVVGFVGADLQTAADPRARADGEGRTDSACVHDLLAGVTETTDAVLDGRVEVRGHLEGVLAMLGAIEVLLDVSARAPALQALAADLRADPAHPPVVPRTPADVGRATHWRPGVAPERERAILARLGLLPDDEG